MATLAEIRNRVRDKLQDENYQASILDQFINDEQRSIYNTYDLPEIETATDLTLTQGDDRISSLPSDMQNIIGLETRAPSNYELDLSPYYLKHRHFFRRFRRSDTQSDGAPTFWTLFEDEIRFPWDADRTYTLELRYQQTIPTLVDDADEPLIPEQFSEILVLGAFERALEREDDYDFAQIQQRKKQAEIQTFINRYSPRQKAKQTVMRNSRRGI